ncbi:hypothetical protein FEM48_Zijuj01G0106500 [Ziziphus jujuba var. spinosa]|uniref:Uncharacterized protein n=1 Tax=Ziziphus jujuba var. spinosa TaxID=714518 RepID=A0A978W0S6_ZIZJJ|nr:hypothetical protein FEM48_Zijuj01G0106500 [Ziziphus jujuba var. spinosa]
MDSGPPKWKSLQVDRLEEISNRLETRSKILTTPAKFGCSTLLPDGPPTNWVGKIDSLPDQLIINLLDYRIREVGKMLDVQFVEASKIDDSGSILNKRKSVRIKKVACCGF